MKYFYFIVLALLVTACTEGDVSTSEEIEVFDDEVLYSLDGLPEHCEEQYLKKKSIHPFYKVEVENTVGITPCYREWLKIMLPKLIFSSDRDVFYKRRGYPQFNLNYRGSFEEDERMFLGTESFFKNSMLGSSPKGRRLAFGSYYGSKESLQHPEIFNAVVIVGVASMQDRKGNIPSVLPPDSLLEVVEKNRDCFIERFIKNNKIVQVHAYIKDGSDILKENIGTEEGEDVLSRKQACYVSALYTYFGMGNIYKYRKYFFTYDLIRNNEKFTRLRTLLQRERYLFRIIQDKDLPSGITEEEFNQKIDAILDKHMFKVKAS